MRYASLLLLPSFLFNNALHAQINYLLVAHYPLDGNATDIVAGNNGSVTGATATTDRFGNPTGAMHFDGISDHIEIASLPASVYNSTVSLWVRPTSLAQQGFAFTYGVDDGSTSNGYGLGIGDGSTGPGYGPGDQLQVNQCGNSFYDGVHVFADTVSWVHLVIVEYGGASIDVYANNALMASYFDPANESTAPWHIGSATGIRFFNGDIDEVRVYDRYMGAGGVDSLYNLQNTAGMESLKGWAAQVSVFPNPANDVLHIAAVDHAALARIEVIDHLGHVISVTPAPVRDLDIGGLATGVYQLRFTDREDRKRVVRFVKD